MYNHSMSDGMAEYRKQRKLQHEQYLIDEVVRKGKLAVCQILKIDERRVFSDEQLKGMVKFPLMFGTDKGVECIEYDMYGDPIESSDG